MKPRRVVAVVIVVVAALASLAPAAAAQTAAPPVYETGSPAPTATEVEPDGAFADALPIGLGDVMAGKIGFGGDRDTFLFTPARSTTFLVDIDAQSTGSALDPVVCLYDAQTVPPAAIACNDNSNGLDSLVYYHTHAPVYIRVTHANHPNEGGAAYGYKLSVYRPLFVSAATGGAVAGIPFTRSDVLAHYDFGDGTERWLLFFDASDVGVTQNLVALDAPNSNGQGFTFALAAPQTLVVYEPAAGDFRPALVKPQDVLSFTALTFGTIEPYGQFGPTTLGRFFADYPGVSVGLTAAGEKIDALGGGVSTTGKAVYPNGLTAQDEDLSEPYTGRLTFDGSLVSGLAARDVTGADAWAWNDERLAYDRYLLVIAGGGRVDGLVVTPSDIFNVDGPAGRATAMVWSGPAHHFTVAIDAFDAVDPYDH